MLTSVHQSLVWTIVMWKCHIDKFPKAKFYIILGRYIITVLLIYIKVSEHIIKGDA